MDIRVCVCVQCSVRGSVKLALWCCDASRAYCAVLDERLPHVGSEPLVGITRCVRLHDGVIDEGREVRAHSGQVTAVCQPWMMTEVIAKYSCRVFVVIKGPMCNISEGSIGMKWRRKYICASLGLISQCK